MSNKNCNHTTDPPPQPGAAVQPDVNHAARCFRDLMRRQSICEGLRLAIRRESDREARRRLRWVLRRAETKERAAIRVMSARKLAESLPNLFLGGVRRDAQNLVVVFKIVRHVCPCGDVLLRLIWGFSRSE